MDRGIKSVVKETYSLSAALLALGDEVAQYTGGFERWESFKP